MATFWAIWLERNNCIFEDGIEESVAAVWDKIKVWVVIWLFDVKEFKGCFFSNLGRAWGFFLQFGVFLALL